MAQKLGNHEDAAPRLVPESHYLSHNPYLQNVYPYPVTPHLGTSAIAIPK
jgi:hypothetical protein